MTHPPLVKICGLSTPESLECALKAGADMVGFVFFPPSPRHLSLTQGAALRAGITTKASAVALVVDGSDDEIAAIIAEVKPDLLQLHGKETPERVQELRARFGRPVIKAIGVSSAPDLEAVKAYENLCDWILLDAKPPTGAVLPGGNGLSFDWGLLANFQCTRPWLLSGGLTPANVRDALAQTHAPAVDVSSGVEISKGVKDLALIRHFIAEAKGVELPLGN